MDQSPDETQGEKKCKLRGKLERISTQLFEWDNF